MRAALVGFLLHAPPAWRVLRSAIGGGLVGGALPSAAALMLRAAALGRREAGTQACSAPRRRVRGRCARGHTGAER